MIFATGHDKMDSHASTVQKEWSGSLYAEFGRKRAGLGCDAGKESEVESCI